MVEKTLYDVDGLGSRYGENCPKFILDEETQIVSLIDRKGNRASMTVLEFNKIAKAFKTGEIKDINMVLRK